MNSMTASVVARMVNLGDSGRSHSNRREMFGTDFAMALDSFKAHIKPGSSRADEHATAGAVESELDSGSRASTERNERDCRSRSSTSLSPANSGVNADLPDLTVAVGVHKLARIHLEPSRGQPELGRQRSLPDQSEYVGSVPISERPLVDTLGHFDPAIPCCAEDRASLGMEPVGDRAIVRGVR